MENPYKYLENDSEPNPALRKLRNLLGYGYGWKFTQALGDWLFPKLLVIGLFAIWLYLASHLEVTISWSK